MLDDREFYSPIVAKDPEPTGPANPMAHMMRLRGWRPVAGDDAVTMDNEKPFVGDESPRMNPAPAERYQSGTTRLHAKTPRPTTH